MEGQEGMWVSRRVDSWDPETGWPCWGSTEMRSQLLGALSGHYRHLRAQGVPWKSCTCLCNCWWVGGPMSGLSKCCGCEWNGSACSDANCKPCLRSCLVPPLLLFDWQHQIFWLLKLLKHTCISKERKKSTAVTVDQLFSRVFFFFLIHLRKCWLK